MIIHTYQEQIGELGVLVSKHSENALSVAESSLDSKIILAECQKKLALAHTVQDSFQSDLERFESALSCVERDHFDSASALDSLEGWRFLIIDESSCCNSSLSKQGLLRSPDDILNQLLSPDDLHQVQSYLDRPVFERLKWTKGDYLACAGCLLLGLALEMLNLAWKPDSPIDPNGHLQEWFNRQFHHHPPHSPIDYQGPGFGGVLHRVRSRGHDLSRFLEAVNQTAQGEFRGVRWSYGKPIEVISRLNQNGNAYLEMPWIAALVNVTVHLMADFFSAHSLPLPLSSVVCENAAREMRILIHNLYEGGFNLRHVALGGLEVLLSYLGIEIWLWMQYGTDRRNTDPISLKRYEMRTAVMGMLSGFNIAGCALFEDPFLINIPTLVAALDFSVQLMLIRSKQNSWTQKAIRNLDELCESWQVMASSLESA